MIINVLCTTIFGLPFLLIPLHTLLIDLFQRSLASGFDTLYMYWPPDSEKESNVFLLAKNVKRGSKSISKVYVSKNYGKNFTDLDAQLVLQNGTAALIDQIYSSKADPKLVSTHLSSCSFNFDILCFVFGMIVLIATNTCTIS